MRRKDMNAQGADKKAGRLKRISITHNVRITVIVLLSIFLAASACYRYVVEYYQKYIDESYPVYSYSCNAAIGYKVFIVPNEVITDESLSEDQVYITQLVDYIDTTFGYEFNGDKTAEINGTYSAIAYLQGVIKGAEQDKVLWSKEYKLLPEEKFSESNETVANKYEVPIKLNNYIRYADEVRKKLINISLDVILTVKYNISIEAKTDNGTVTEVLSPSLKIPISKEYFQVTKNSVEKKTGTLNESKKELSPLYEIKTMLCWILMALFALALLFVLIFTKTLVLSPLQREIDRIFNKYGSRIVLLSSGIQSEAKEVIEVSAVDGLVRISDDLGKPIFYAKGKYNENSSFSVRDDSFCYIFTPPDTGEPYPEEKTSVRKNNNKISGSDDIAELLKNLK